MPDISLCLNNKCPLGNKCRRMLAIPSALTQSYMNFKFTIHPTTGEVSCDDFQDYTNFSDPINIHRM